jgi:hypothetical protein
MGGLGNQIFQIFATISYSIKTNNPFNFANLKKLGNRSTYWNTFFYKLQPYLISYNTLAYKIKELNFNYNELPIHLMINRNIIIYGYFQSYKYFQEHYEYICELIGLDLMKQSLLTKLNKSIADFENIVSMHFRLGDYKNIPECHPLASYKYYQESLKFIQNINPTNNYTVLFFCENDDIDDVHVKINNLQIIFPTYTFIRGDPLLEDWEQLLLMSCCHHNIIANSSFSWWSAYFNSWKDKMIFYPSTWFGPALNYNTSDLCPNEWIKINT